MSYMIDPCRSERAGEPDELPIRWTHRGFGTHAAEVIGVRVLVRMVHHGRRPVAYVASAGNWHSADVPFGDDRRVALRIAKALAVEHVIAWGPPA